MVAGNRGGHGSWQSHRSRIQIIMILSQQVILNFYQMGQGMETTRELGQNKSCCLNPLLLFYFDYLSLVTGLFHVHPSE